MLLLYFTSTVTIDLAGNFTVKTPLFTFAPLNSFIVTAVGFSNEL
jgi:hypothetical protein